VIKERLDLSISTPPTQHARSYLTGRFETSITVTGSYNIAWLEERTAVASG
jgi:hypothetical protein